jgi:hypothetical protein
MGRSNQERLDSIGVLGLVTSYKLQVTSEETNYFIVELFNSYVAGGGSFFVAGKSIGSG